MKKGFTLIELIAVIVILALLAMVTIPMIIGTLNNSKEKSFTTDVKELVSISQQDITENDRKCTKKDDICSYEYKITNEGKKLYEFVDTNDNIKLSGSIENLSGSIFIDEDGKAYKVNIWNESLKKCAVLDNDNIVIDEKITSSNKCFN